MELCRGLDEALLRYAHFMQWLQQQFDRCTNSAQLSCDSLLVTGKSRSGRIAVVNTPLETEREGKSREQLAEPTDCFSQF